MKDKSDDLNSKASAYEEKQMLFFLNNLLHYCKNAKKDTVRRINL